LSAHCAVLENMQSGPNWDPSAHKGLIASFRPEFDFFVACSCNRSCSCCSEMLLKQSSSFMWHVQDSVLASHNFAIGPGCASESCWHGLSLSSGLRRV